MVKGAVRLQARQELVSARERIRLDRAAKDRRIEDAALDVRVQLGLRHECDVAAGAALELLFDEGLTAADVLAWCGGALTRGEVSRLRAVARDTRPSPGDPA